MKKIYLFIVFLSLMILPLGVFANENPLKLSWDFQLDKDKPLETFKIDIDSPDYNQKDGNNAAVVLLKNGNVIAKLPFRLALLINEPVHPEFSFLTPEGFSPDVKILQVDFQPQACAVVGGKYMFLWDGKNLYEGPVTMRVSDAGVFNVTSDVILPEDQPLGEQNTITVMTFNRDWDDKIDNYSLQSINVEKYFWDGKEMKKTSNKEYKHFVPVD